MEGIAQRMESRDFEWVVMAIRIQREVGGNLAELLLTVAATLREREYLRRHVRALSAEGRLSCYVLGGLPPAFLAYLVLSKPEYVKPLVHHPHRLHPVHRHGRPAGRGHGLDDQGCEGGRVITLILPLGFVLIFAALFLVFAHVGGVNKERAGVGRSIAVLEALTAAPEEMKAELEQVLQRPGPVPAAGQDPADGAPAHTRGRQRPHPREAGEGGQPVRLDRGAGDGRQGRRLRGRADPLPGRRPRSWGSASCPRWDWS